MTTALIQLQSDKYLWPLFRSDVCWNDSDRRMYYKEGYLVDFPRPLNRFEHRDCIQQADISHKLLRKSKSTISSAHSISLAAIESWEYSMIITWDEFKDGKPANDSVLCMNSILFTHYFVYIFQLIVTSTPNCIQIYFNCCCH